MDLIFDGKTYAIEVEPPTLTGEIKARVNDAAFNPTAIKVSENCLLLFMGDKIQRAYIAANGPNVYVHLDGKVIWLERFTDERKSFSKEALEFGAKDQISTPMPGKVVKILVEVGEKVTLKQPLVIVESMKMENEIKSPTNGTIKSIHFGPGDLVGTGQPIIKIEPEK